MRKLRRVLAPVSGLVLLLSGCQAILGFEELEPASDGGGMAGNASAGGSGDGDGKGTSGVVCDAAADCAEDLTCLFGYCRAACLDDTYCEQGSVCLWGGEGFGGCRLANETCERDGCDNAELVCGLDGTCRIACSDVSSCEAPTQRCVAGTCVSTVGEDAAIWDCGGVPEGEISCSDGQLSVCNVTEPGLAAIEDCGGTALCERSLPADPSYDPEAPPECLAGCAADEAYCDHGTLLVCKDDGSGPIDAGESCASQALCERAAAAGETACPAPACEEDETRCSGGQTELVVQRCAEERDGFEDSTYCEELFPQCNPGGGRCFELFVDATEVTVAAYNVFLATSPTGANQAQACGDNLSFVPDAQCMALSAAPDCADCEQPVVCVDWCDAAAYCASQGKHLCGRIGGGMNPFEDYADAGSSEWMNACSAGGQFEWGGGAAPAAQAGECVHEGTQLSESYPVGTRAKCKSPSPGYRDFFDLSGNVEEWEDSCEKDAESGDFSDACRTRGGSFVSPRDETRCDAVPASAAQRSDVSPTLGFRCCGRASLQ